MRDSSHGSACLDAAPGTAPSQIRISHNASPQVGKRVSPPATFALQPRANDAPAPNPVRPERAADASNGLSRVPPAHRPRVHNCGAPRVRQAAPPAQLGSSAGFCGGSGSDRLRRAQRAKARRDWVQRAGAAPATVPMWPSRAAWVDGLRSWATDAVVRAVCARLGCSITSATLLSIAVVMAAHADHLTGRNMAATRATIALRVGCSPRTVTTAWRVLNATGWALEAARGHGGPGVPGVGRRASVWHLMTRRDTAASVDFFHLPSPLGLGSFSLVGNNSPSARSGARRPDRTQKPTRRYRAEAEPRPLALQRLAADLVLRVRSLDRGHVGAICDALTAAGIDPQVWTGRQIRDALDADMRQSGWSWPDRIDHPGGFLVSRLRRLTRGGTAASQDKAESSRPTPMPAAHVPEPHQPLTDDQRTRIGRIQAEIRARLAARQTTPHERAWPATARRVVATAPALPHSGTCAHCGAASAPARPFLPRSRAHVCDPCWSTNGT